MTGGIVEVCANCGRKIGKLETPMAWQDQLVCSDCHTQLERHSDKLPTWKPPLSPKINITGAIIIGVSILFAAGALVWQIGTQIKSQKETIVAHIYTMISKVKKASATNTSKLDLLKNLLITTLNKTSGDSLHEQRMELLLHYQLAALRSIEAIAPNNTNQNAIQLNKAGARIAVLSTADSILCDSALKGDTSAIRFYLLLVKAHRAIANMQLNLSSSLPSASFTGHPYTRQFVNELYHYGVSMFAGGSDPSTFNDFIMNHYKGAGSGFNSKYFYKKYVATMSADFHQAFLEWQKAQALITSAQTLISTPIKQ